MIFIFCFLFYLWTILFIYSVYTFINFLFFISCFFLFIFPFFRSHSRPLQHSSTFDFKFVPWKTVLRRDVLDGKWYVLIIPLFFAYFIFIYLTGILLPLPDTLTWYCVSVAFSLPRCRPPHTDSLPFTLSLALPPFTLYPPSLLFLSLRLRFILMDWQRHESSTTKVRTYVLLCEEQ